MITSRNEPEERYIVADERRFVWARCWADVAPFLTRQTTWRALATEDIKSKYRRTLLGPWWITAANALTALTMAFVAGHFLGAEMRIYLPHFMVSITIWSFISSSLNEACYTLIGASGMIKAVEMPLLIYVMRMVHRNLIIFLHNIAIIPIVWIFYPWSISPQVLLVPCGLLIVYVAVSSCALILSMICVRYRDVPPIMPSVMQLLFFISPIIWIPSQIKGGEWILALNPIAYFLAITRDPLMGTSSSIMPWLIAIGITTAIAGAMAYIYTRYRARVVFWV